MLKDVRRDRWGVLEAVRREQITEILFDLAAASAIRRFVFMVNHADGSERILNALSPARVVFAFPGAAGSINGGVDHYVEIDQQPTAVDTNAEDIIALFRGAGFRVARVRDMDAWLRRHAIFVTAVAGALYEAGGDARRLAASPEGVGTFIKAVREGWSALDRRGVKPAPLALRTILCWIPLPLAIAYWQRLLRSARGELYFAAHARHAPIEMAALVADVRELLDDVPTPCLDRLYAAVKAVARERSSGSPPPEL
jgi:2-dehydropantoate 2-reductase